MSARLKYLLHSGFGVMLHDKLIEGLDLIDVALLLSELDI